MKLVQTIEVAFNDTPAEIPAIEVNDRCTIHNINVSRHKNITAVDTTFGFFLFTSSISTVTQAGPSKWTLWKLPEQDYFRHLTVDRLTKNYKIYHRSFNWVAKLKLIKNYSLDKDDDMWVTDVTTQGWYVNDRCDYYMQDVGNGSR